MRILFVWTNKDQIGYKPLGISLLAPILKGMGHEVSLFDTTFIDFGYRDNTEDRRRIRIFKPMNWSGFDMSKKKTTIEAELIQKLNEFNPDIVAVSSLSDEILIGFEVSRVVKKWNSRTIIIWGNKAVTTEPERILNNKNIDFGCIGEGIKAVPEFVSCIEDGGNPKKLQNIAYRKDGGGIKINPLRPYFQDLDSLPYLDWSLFDNRHLLKPFDGEIKVGGDCMIGWGCPNACTYCINEPTRELYGKNAGKYMRRYSVDRIISELKHLRDMWGLNLIIFHDEDFTAKPDAYLTLLAEQYRRHVNVPFAAMVNAKHINERTVDYLKEMNCLSVSIGIETGNALLRKKVLNRTESRAEIIHAFNLLNDEGIRTSSFNMLGIPGETRKTLEETVELNRQAQPRYPNNVYFFPYRGTKLGEFAIKQGMFDPNSGAVYEQDKPALTLPTISTGELIAFRERFVLYVKMPERYHIIIKRSERNDGAGRKLTEMLFLIYDTYVLENNGIWTPDEKEEEQFWAMCSLITEELSRKYQEAVQ